MTIVLLICVLCGLDQPVPGLTPAQRHTPKGAEQWLKSPRLSELPRVPAVRQAEPAAPRHSRAAASNPSPRCTAAKKIWIWRRNSPPRREDGCVQGRAPYDVVLAPQPAPSI